MKKIISIMTVVFIIFSIASNFCIAAESEIGSRMESEMLYQKQFMREERAQHEQERLEMELIMQEEKELLREEDIISAQSAELSSDVFYEDGDGSEKNPYQISTPQQLDAVRYNMSASYILKNDIDLSDWGNWEPIGGSRDNSFKGNFDGNNKSINGMAIVIESDIYIYAGLFGYVNGCTIKNLNMIDSIFDITGTFFSVYAGGIVGYALDSKISKCTNSGIVSAISESSYNNANANAGGVVGYVSGSISISECTNSGSISATSSSRGAYIGGIVGYASADGLASITVSDCINSGYVSATSTTYYQDFVVGGIVGYVTTNAGSSGSITIMDCTNYGDVSANSSNGDGYVGGIVGNAMAITISGCANSGEISATAITAYTGGIAGYAIFIEISNCTNSGFVSAISSDGGAYTGGIVGFIYANDENSVLITIRECSNSGSASATSTSEYQYPSSTSGGIVGGAFIYSYDVSSITISDCINIGEIVAASISGGIVGQVSCSDLGSITISNCTNIGGVSAISYNHKPYAGGIVGYAETLIYSYITIIGCTNSGCVSAESTSTYLFAYAYAGGIIGYAGAARYSPITIIDCTNNSSVNSSVTATSAAYSDTYAIAGGIVGYAYHIDDDDYCSSIMIRECKNYRVITANGNGIILIGGLIGYLDKNFIIEPYCYYIGPKAIGGQSDYTKITGLENAILLDGSIKTYEILKPQFIKSKNQIKTNILITKREDSVGYDTVIMAVYDEQGLLLGIDKKEIILDINTSENIEFTVNNRNAANVKIFIWDDMQNLMPLSHIIQEDII